MLERTERILLYSEFILFYLRWNWSRKPEPELHTGSDSDQNVPTTFDDKTLYCNYEIILYYFQLVLRNSLDPDPDSGVFRIHIEIFGSIPIRIRVQ